ncbi:MAG TPA: helix-turn-helix transcriptional regulator [Actinomycetota bacterium]|nr:helix-turn-helix transcriptional regulator [Actinomycetota bacterium]
MAEDPSGRGRLARRLDALFRTVHPPGEKEYSNEAVAEALRAAGVPRVSGAYLQQLRNGVKDNPSTRLVLALAAFFGVKRTYFFEDEEAAQADLGVAVLTRLVDADMFDTAARLADLPADGRELVRQVVDHLAQLQGLPNVPPSLLAGPTASDADGRADAEAADGLEG